ncbi:DUF3137 domain-containing protein [Jannaschia sp. R86511]|uniref:DUF3137 domain-containing protein n=1 Tax=Jannaschia sp. R86511 TaxID=3093853 RepID=UPI0036D2C41B
MDGQWFAPALALLLLAAVLVGVALSVVADRRRRERLLVWSAERRWDWRATDERLVGFLPGEPFGRGRSRRVGNVVSGTWDGRPALGFDYRYKVTTGSGKNRRTRTYRYAVAAVHLPVALPRVHVGPENAFHRVAQAFGVDDIEVESHEFNRRYTVEADDRRAAFSILHPRLVETLSRVEPVEWRTDTSVLGPVLVSWWRGSLEAVELQQRLILLDAVVDSVPDYVWRDAGWEPGDAGQRS